MTTQTKMAQCTPIIPRPAVLDLVEGKDYTVPERLSVAAGDAARPVAAFLVEGLQGIGFAAESSVEREAAIRLELSDEAGDPEGYELVVSVGGITLRAADPAGLFYGVQSLLQLFPAEATSPIRIPCLEVRDSPRFGWRGLHLDVARHFFPVPFVKKFIDVMARYKLNTFHWHLTEDQGWRIEIKKYPKLTEVGAWREETLVGRHRREGPRTYDGVPHGGYYTQDEIREVVAYAAERFVTIVPEIEMPGHATAALAAYPELANDEGPEGVATDWGIHDNIFSPAEETFEFLSDVLEEVVSLFPGEYIHIGGDEVPKAKWKSSEFAQGLMRREGLANEEELQSWFVRRIEKVLQKFGRKLVGWDEILEGGLAPDATVMSWRGEKGGIASAKMGHDVVMTPGFALYFDHYQAAPAYEPLAIGGFTPLEKVYRYDPVPAELSAEEARHIRGVQANVWTEYMKTPEQVEYMTFPRALALSEVAWIPPDLKEWDGFAARVVHHLGLLERAGVHCHLPAPSAVVTERDAGTCEIALATIFPDAEIRYTWDESEPDDLANRYRDPIAVTRTEGERRTLTAVAVLPDGRRTGILQETVGDARGA